MDALYTGKVIAECRKELGLTQKELADKLGVTDKAVSRWENGMNFPDIALMDSLAQISRIYEVMITGIACLSGLVTGNGILSIRKGQELMSGTEHRTDLNHK